MKLLKLLETSLRLSFCSIMLASAIFKNLQGPSPFAAYVPKAGIEKACAS